MRQEAITFAETKPDLAGVWCWPPRTNRAPTCLNWATRRGSRPSLNSNWKGHRRQSLLLPLHRWTASIAATPQQTALTATRIRFATRSAVARDTGCNSISSLRAWSRFIMEKSAPAQKPSLGGRPKTHACRHASTARRANSWITRNRVRHAHHAHTPSRILGCFGCFITIIRYLPVLLP